MSPYWLHASWVNLEVSLCFGLCWAALPQAMLNLLCLINHENVQGGAQPSKMFHHKYLKRMLGKWSHMKGERWIMAVPKKKASAVTTEPWNIAWFFTIAVPSWWRCYWASKIAGEGKRCDCGVWSQCKPRLHRSPMPVYRSWMQHQEYPPQYARLRFLYLPVSLSSWSLDLPLDGSCVFWGKVCETHRWWLGRLQVTLHKFAVLAAAPSVFQDVSSWRGHEWSRNHQKHLKQVRICMVYVLVFRYDLWQTNVYGLYMLAPEDHEVKLILPSLRHLCLCTDHPHVHRELSDFTRFALGDVRLEWVNSKSR